MLFVSIVHVGSLSFENVRSACTRDSSNKIVVVRYGTKDCVSGTTAGVSVAARRRTSSSSPRYVAFTGGGQLYQYTPGSGYYPAASTNYPTDQRSSSVDLHVQDYRPTRDRCSFLRYKKKH